MIVIMALVDKSVEKGFTVRIQRHSEGTEQLVPYEVQDKNCSSYMTA